MDRIDIALAPDLDIKAQNFVDAWNAGEESRAIAVAKADHADAEHFEPLSLTAVLVGIAAGVRRLQQQRRCANSGKVEDISSRGGSHDLSNFSRAICDRQT